MKKSIVVTGATGLVGSNVLKQLSKEYEIYALVRTILNIPTQHATYIEWQLNESFLTNVLPNKIDAVVHLAQSNHMREFPAKALDIFNVNLRSTALLLDYAQKAKASHFIFTSTGGLYGSNPEPMDESTTVNIPKGSLEYYFHTKYACENLINIYSEHMHVHILRPFFIYGQEQKDSMLLPRLIHNVRNNNPILLQGKNGILINPVHVHDVVRLIEKCLEINQNSVINVSGPDLLSIKAISELIGEHLGIPPKFRYQEEIEGNIIGSNERMQSVLKCPLIPFKQGILDLLEN